MTLILGRNELKGERIVKAFELIPVFPNLEPVRNIPPRSSREKLFEKLCRITKNTPAVESFLSS